MWQPVLMISGYFISVLGIAMLFPAALDIYDTHQNWSPFLSSAIVALFVGMSLYLGNHTKIHKISIQQGYLLTVVSWFSVSLMAAIPFVFSGAINGWDNAIFEAASGISTTGATIITNLDNAPRSILLWRAILNGLGGVGIVIFAIAMLPFLGIGGMQIFQRENSDFNDKLMPKISYIAKRIIIIYLILTITCIICLYFAGMNMFDAICHGIATIATGGMSTKNASIGYFNSPLIETIVMIFMIIGALPLMLYHTIIINRGANSLRVEQVKFFLKILLFYVGGTTLWLIFKGTYNLQDAIRYASFNVVSLTTSTGFSSTDYLQWGPFATTIFIIFAMTGGCTGSTAGSIKIFRWQVIWGYLKRAIITTIEPNRVISIKIGHLTGDNRIVSSVFTFFTAYFFCFVALSLLIGLSGVDFDTNTGPSISEITGPAGNYSEFNAYCKYILSFAMLLGRLDVLTVLALFSRNFWNN